MILAPKKYILGVAVFRLNCSLDSVSLKKRYFKLSRDIYICIVFSNMTVSYTHLGGGRLLGEVIKEQRLVDSNIYKALDELAARTEKPAEPFSEMSAERLVEFILTKHHSYLWGALPEAHELIVNVLKAHGRRHPELYDVYKLLSLIHI